MRSQSKAYEVAPNAIHLYQMCALKIMNEAVIEGMCKTVAKHAGGKRGLHLERYKYESIIAHISSSSGFMNASMQRYGATNKSDMLRFVSTDKNQRALTTFVSKVVDRHVGAKSRLEFMCDND